MQTVFISLGALGLAAFGISALALFILWIYLCLRITGHISENPGRDAVARRYAAMFGKLFVGSIVYNVVVIIVIHIVGPPH